jgi:hypothetical protein
MQIPQWQVSEDWIRDPSLLTAQQAELAAERGLDDLLQQPFADQNFRASYNSGLSAKVN